MKSYNFLNRFRLAPEFPYPIPVNDCYDVTRYVLNNCEEFGCDPERVIVAGDSSGKKLIHLIFYFTNN